MARKIDIQEFAPDTLMLGFICTKDVDGLKEKVAILDRFGLPDAVIGRILDKNEQAVRNTRRAPKTKKG